MQKGEKEQFASLQQGACSKFTGIIKSREVQLPFGIKPTQMLDWANRSKVPSQTPNTLNAFTKTLSSIKYIHWVMISDVDLSTLVHSIWVLSEY